MVGGATIKEALNLAVGKHQEGKLEEAKIIYERILEEDAFNSDALNLLGAIDYQQGRFREAVEKIGGAIRLKPNDAIYYYNLAMAYDSLNEEEKSAESFEKVLEIEPDYGKAYVAHYNLGIYYANKGEIVEALEHYNKAVEFNKNFFDARWNRALCLLLLGRFEEGWEDYKSRFKKEESIDTRIINGQRWDGSNLEGKRILVVSEQGFGDNIQFVRYLPLIKEKGGHVVLECKKELMKLFSGFSAIDELVERKKGLVPDVDYDFYVHLMDLPGIFETVLETIPNDVPYLRADEDLVEKFKSFFGKKSFKIGIVWSGNPEQMSNKNRAVPFEKFKTLKDFKGVEFFSLQKGEPSRELNDKEVVNVAEEINDFADTAAIIENLDLIISTDTAVVHLAGAMGKPVWVLLSAVPDWRWLLDRKDSPWYPSMKLFRQKKLGDWDSVFEEVIGELGYILN